MSAFLEQNIHTNKRRNNNYDNKLCIYDKTSNNLKRVDFTIKMVFTVEF